MELRTFVLLALIGISQQQYQRQWYYHPRFSGNPAQSIQQGWFPDFAPSVVAKAEADDRRWMNYYPSASFQTDDSVVIVAPKKVGYEADDGYVYPSYVHLREPLRTFPDNVVIPSPKLFFGGGGVPLVNGPAAAAANPLIRTVAVIVTSTMNVTSAVNCLDLKDFDGQKDPGKACRRRRNVLVGNTDDVLERFIPSEKISVETTAARDLHEKENTRIATLLASSKDELITTQEIYNQSPSSSDYPLKREKRLFFPTQTTTLTSFIFVTQSSTRTVKLAAADLALLTCVPSGFVVCK